MTGLDSSVVVRLLVGEPVEQLRRAEAFLDEIFEAGEKASVSDLVVSEVYFALQYHYKVPKAEALRALKELFEGGEIEATGAALEVLRTPRLASAKPGFVDRLIHRGYLESGEPMVTFEKRAVKLAGVRVL